MAWIVERILVPTMKGVSLRLLRRALLLVAFIMIANTMLLYYTNHITPLTYVFHHQMQNQENTVDGRRADATTLAVLFTTFTNSPQKAQLFSNTVMNWATFIPHIRPILFSADRNNSLNTLAKAHGWTVVPCPKVNKYGTPVLKDMYLAAYKLMPELPFYAFVNGDIMFSPSTLTTLRRLVLELPVLNTTLVSGRRWDYDVPDEATFEAWSQAEVALLATKRHAKLSPTHTEDYFFVTRDFPWQGVQDVVIGRVSYDNYLVARAIQMNVTTVDASLTMSALHQKGKYTDRDHLPGSVDINKKLVGKFDFEAGRAHHMRLQTEFDYKNNVCIKSRQ